MASFTVSPLAAPAGAVIKVSLVGTTTSWNTTTPTFTASGSPASGTISSIAYQDATHATFTLALGSSGGLLTITDPSTGATAQMEIAQFATATDETFGGADTSVGAAGSTTGWGNSWTDRLGGVASVSSHTGALANNSTALGLDRQDAAEVVLRPLSEASLNQRVRFETGALSEVAGAKAWEAVLRAQANGYGSFSLESQYSVQISSSGAVTVSRTAHYYTSNALTGGSGSFAPTVGHDYEVDACAIDRWNTVLVVTVRDLTADPTRTAAPALTLSVVEGTAALQSDGRSGVGLPSGASAAYARVTTFSYVPSGPLAVSSSGSAFGTTGAGPSGVGRTAGVLLACRQPVGGTPPYTYQWHRFNGANGSFATSGATAIAGAASQDSYDANRPALAWGSFHTYRVVVTDAASATTTPTGVSLGDYGTSSNFSQFPMTDTGGPVYCGDSITYGFGGTGNAPSGSYCNFASAGLSGDGAVTSLWTVANAASALNDWGAAGYTSSQWLTGITNKAIAQALASGYNVGVIMLGTNDSRDSVATSAAQYRANIKAIMDAFRAAGLTRFVLVKLPWMPVGAYAADFSASSQARIQSYNTQLDTLADGASVVVTANPYATFSAAGYPGTASAANYPPRNGEALLSDGLHPSAGGHQYLGYHIALPAVKAALLGQWTPLTGGGSPRRPR